MLSIFIDMHNVLAITHTQPVGYTYGGPVYRQGLFRLLRTAFHDIALDECILDISSHGLKKKLRQIVSLVRSFVSPLPAKVVHFRSNRTMKVIARAVRQQRYSIVIINNSEMLWCLDMMPKHLRTVCVAHNVEHLLYREQVKPLLCTPLLGRLLRQDANKLQRFETEMLAKVGQVITVSEEDRRTLISLIPELRAVTILPSFDSTVVFRPTSTSTREVHLAFLGNLDWWPNRRSIEWYFHCIHPSVTSPITLHLFGQGSERYRGIPQVVPHGFVKDIEEVWRTADIMIQPIRAGAGINIKVAESIYNRMPMLTTGKALRGIPLNEDEAIVKLEQPSAWINFLNSPSLLQLRGKNTRPENARLFSSLRNADILRDFLLEKL